MSIERVCRDSMYMAMSMESVRGDSIIIHGYFTAMESSTLVHTDSYIRGYVNGNVVHTHRYIRGYVHRR